MVVEVVNLLTQLLDTLCGDVLITDNQQREDVVEHIRRYLLLGITPSLVRIAVALDNQAIEAHIRKYPEEWFWLHDRWKSVREIGQD